MPGIEGTECEDHDECEARELGLGSGPRTSDLRRRAVEIHNHKGTEVHEGTVFSFFSCSFVSVG